MHSSIRFEKFCNILQLLERSSWDYRCLIVCRDGIQLRKNSWQDGVAETNCPIQPGSSWTYTFKAKDQIGSYYYYPSLKFQKAAGGFGSIRVNPRRIISSPFVPPADDYAVLIGDWYKTDHQVRRLSNFFTCLMLLNTSLLSQTSSAAPGTTVPA